MHASDWSSIDTPSRRGLRDRSQHRQCVAHVLARLACSRLLQRSEDGWCESHQIGIVDSGSDQSLDVSI